MRRLGLRIYIMLQGCGSSINLSYFVWIQMQMLKSGLFPIKKRQFFLQECCFLIPEIRND